MATLSSVISVLPKVPEVTLPDDTDCFEELEPRPLREAKNTVNEYNLARFTFLPVESAVAIDMMHMMHNLFDHFVPFLLGKSIDLTEEEEGGSKRHTPSRTGKMGHGTVEGELHFRDGERSEGS